MVGEKVKKREKEGVVEGDIVGLDRKRGRIMVEVEKELNWVMVR